MRWLLAWVVVAVGGCGRVGFDVLGGANGQPDADPSDATADAMADAATDAMADAAIDAPAGSMTVTFGETGTATFAGVTTDTSLVIGAADQLDNFGGGVGIEVGLNNSVAVLRFDLSAIAPTATVVSARVRLTTNNNTSPGVVRAYRLSESWTEGTNTNTPGVANWIQRHAGVAWTTAGAGAGSHDATMLGSQTPSMPSTPYTLILATAQVQSWITAPTTNNGMVLHEDSADSVDFISSEGASPSARPLFTVTYLP